MDAGCALADNIGMAVIVYKIQSVVTMYAKLARMAGTARNILTVLAAVIVPALQHRGRAMEPAFSSTTPTARASR